jgi:hypothetical protein
MVTPQPLTNAQILSLAPDAASAKAGTALATAGKWRGLGGDGRALWGECQGSGARPYQTRIDLADLGSRCSCPSRKFPCKHALGLLLLFASQPELFAAVAPPVWVAEWLATRAERAERRAPPHAAPDAPPDSAAQARRAGAREVKVRAGLDELARWLGDLVRSGIAGAPSRPAAFWDAMAARLVDAQAPGAARLVRQLGALPATGERWPDRMLAQLGRLHLLCEAYRRLDEQPPAVQADVRTHVGFGVGSTELEAEPAVADHWLVVGQVIEDDDRLRARRTWLTGRASRRRALLLDFAHGTAPFAEAVPPVGATLDAELVFYPGSYPQRAAVRERSPAAGGGTEALPTGDGNLAAATLAYARALAADPWTERVLLVLDGVVPEPRDGRWLLRDARGDALPLSSRAPWPLLALSGGHPVWLSGEWDGDALLPLAAATPGAPPISLAASHAA